MSTIADIDRRHLARAIDLAERGRGNVSPNPLVGAVLADEHGMIAEGFHSASGSAHAEVEAIRAAGGRDLAASTLYVSLEPCCHQGRTPPCTDAIRGAGIRRVVVASDDPQQVCGAYSGRESKSKNRQGHSDHTGPVFLSRSAGYEPVPVDPQFRHRDQDQQTVRLAEPVRRHLRY